MLWLPGSVPYLFSTLLCGLVNSSPVSSLTPPTHCHPVPQVTLSGHGANHAIPIFQSRHQSNPDSLCVGSKPFIAQLSVFHFSSLTPTPSSWDQPLHLGILVLCMLFPRLGFPLPFTSVNKAIPHSSTYGKVLSFPTQL